MGSSSTAAGKKLELHSVHLLISIVDHHIHLLLQDTPSRHSLHRRCRAGLSGSQYGGGFLEFSDQSVVANLYWGIEAVESAIASSDSEDDKASRLAEAEQMLQMPALLEEDGATANIENRYIVCCSYFYLSMVRQLRGDLKQMAMHFLQSVLVSPGLARKQLAPELCDRLFGSQAQGEINESREQDDDVVRQRARRCKDWLIYYQVVSYGEAPARSKDQLFIDWNTSFTSTITSSCPDFGNVKENLDIRCLEEILQESRSDSPASSHSQVGSIKGRHAEEKDLPVKLMCRDPNVLTSKLTYRKSPMQKYALDSAMIFVPDSPLSRARDESHAAQFLHSSRSDNSFRKFAHSVVDSADSETYTFCSKSVQDDRNATSPPKHDLRCFSNFTTKFRKRSSQPELVPQGSFRKKILSFSTSNTNCSEKGAIYGQGFQTDFVGRFEKGISTLLLFEALGSACDADAEVMTLCELLNNKADLKYNSTRQDILDHLFEIISNQNKEKVIKASVHILLFIIAKDRDIIKDIKRKELYLHNLANALKRNVHEAAVLIYLLDPSPSEIKNLEILPALVDIACDAKLQSCPVSLPLTPSSASMAMIEILVTAFDYVTNNLHLASISSSKVLSKAVDVAMNKNMEEAVALAAVLIRCMSLNGNCKKFLSQVTPMAPFLHLLQRNEERAKCAALEYFHVLLQIPRSSSLCLLEQMRQLGGVGMMNTLMARVHQSEHEEHRLLAANILLQLNMIEKSKGKKPCKELAVEVLLEHVESDGSCSELAAFILSNLGGTFSWAGESYTAAYLMKKASLKSVYHRNLLRNVEGLDSCPQGSDINKWSTRMARSLIRVGVPVFRALAKGLKSKNEIVSHDCLVSMAWLGNEMALLDPNSLRYSVCEILFSDIARFLHPGSELEERILACLCVYNYSAGKGKQQLVNFSEGSRESLRRLSATTWIAEELLRVTDYVLPTKTRVSCVHTQILEIGQPGNCSTSAMVFFKGLLYAGYDDGAIRGWDIRGHKAALATEVKEHKKAITCFALFELGDNLLSGSADKTIRVWKMVHRKLECVDVIQMKEQIQNLETYADQIIAVANGRGFKVSRTSRSIKTISRNKDIRSLAIGALGKLYLGCSDSSIQEVDMMNDHKLEIRAPMKTWRIQKQPTTSIVVYKDWMYCAGSGVEGSYLKDWRKRSTPRATIRLPRGIEVKAMAVVEDFIYLNCSKSQSAIQIWLREKQQKVGRLSAGRKITSILAINDVVYCGLENGLIKAWIPL